MPVKTVAIVGSHVRTRDAAPWGRRDVDIWVFNESVSIGWTKRADAVFQMHVPAVWRNPLNRNDPHYREWLAKPHSYPIYMLERYPDVPASRAYPFERVQEFMPAIYRGRDQGELVDFFSTCTVAYAIALALADGYRRIELYGVEMESDTEYTYQRDSVFYWLGVIGGRGVELIVHPESGFFKAPLYGYEGGVSLHKDDFVSRIARLTPLVEQHKTKLDDAQADLTALLERINGAGPATEQESQAFFKAIRAQTQSLIDYRTLAGALAEAERYAHKADVMDEHGGEHIFARQEFEIVAAQARELRDKRGGTMGALAGEAQLLLRQLQDTLKAGQPAEEVAQTYLEAHERYLGQASEFGWHLGTMNENIEYLGMVDALIKAAGGKKSEEAILLAEQNGHPEPVHA